MKTIWELQDEIRALILRPRKQHSIVQRISAWHMLCSSLDVIGDTQIAISEYQKTAEPQQGGSGYLIAYGILQCLVLQQDAMRHLCEALGLCKPQEAEGHLCEALGLSKPNDSELTKIRGIRNDSVGHPTRRGGGEGKSFNFIVRSSLTKSGFDLLKMLPDEDTDRDMESLHVNIPSLIEKQDTIHRQILSEVLARLRNEENEHRAMFRTAPLQGIFHPTLSYYFGKIYGAIDGSAAPSVGSQHIGYVAETVAAFKEQLEHRGTLQAYTYVLDQFDYPICELCSHFSSLDSSHLNERTAYIYAFFIEKRMDELKEIAAEIDAEYDSEA